MRFSRHLSPTLKYYSLTLFGYNLSCGWGSECDGGWPGIAAIHRIGVNGIRFHIGRPFVVFCWPLRKGLVR